jgi:ankyrin repeat protein
MDNSNIIFPLNTTHDEYNRTSLFRACTYENIDFITKLIEAGEDINHKDIDGNTVVEYMYLMKIRNFDILKLFINNEFDIKNTNRSLLHLECCSERIDLFTLIYFLTLKIDVNYKDTHGMTALMHLINNSNHTIKHIVTVINFDANINDKDCNNKTILMYICENCSINILSISSLTDINKKDINGMTALLYLCKNPNVTVSHFEFILKYGANINDCDNKKTNSLMHLFYNENLTDELLQYMISNNINYKHLDMNNHSLFLLACSLNKINIINILLPLMDEQELNSKIHTVTPLMYSMIFKNKTLTNDLIIRQASIYIKDDDGNSLLSYACGFCCKSPMSVEFINLLLTSGLDINNKNIDGEDVLIYISKYDKPYTYDLIKMLLNNGADVKNVDNNNNSFLDYLHDSEYGKDIIDILFQKKYINIHDSICVRYLLRYKIIKLQYLFDLQTIIIDKQSQDKQCVICYCPLTHNEIYTTCDNNHEYGKIVHYFHKDCLFKWIETSYNIRCPMCNDMIDKIFPLYRIK